MLDVWKMDGRSRRSSGPQWEVPEPGMQTGTVDGQVIGHVVVHGRVYLAFDAVNRPLGRFRSLFAARQATLAAVYS